MLKLFDDGNYKHSLALARVALNPQELSVVGVMPSAEIVAAKDLVRGASKETPFRVLDALHVVAQVGEAEVCEALFYPLVLLPRLEFLILRLLFLV